MTMLIQRGLPLPQPQDPPKQEEVTRLHVGRLTRNVTEAHVREIFSTWGELKEVELAIDKDVNLPRGFCYVEFASRKDAEKAKDCMNGGQIDGNTITCVSSLCAHIKPETLHRF